jgi:putative SOS response-associated peptidase YedK
MAGRITDRGGRRGKRSSVERYTLSRIEGLELPAAVARPRFNIARGQDAAVAIVRAGEPGKRVIAAMRWGMLAPWRGHGGKRPPMIHVAPRDAIDGTTLLRNALRTQRCLVLADGFFAWRRGGKQPRPYWIHTPAPGPAAFAGLWTVHRDDDRPSFAVIVAPAPPSIAPLAPEAPIPAGDAWLGSPEQAREAIEAALEAAPEATLDAWRTDAVSTWVNDVAHDDPRCITPLGNPAQGELF